MKALARISTTLLAPALVAAAALSPVLRDTGPEEQQPAAEPTVDGALQKISSFPTSEAGLPHPTSLAWSPRLDALVVTGKARPNRPRAVSTNGTDLGRFRGSVGGILWVLCGLSAATALWILLSVPHRAGSRSDLRTELGVMGSPVFWRYAPAVAMLSVLNFAYLGLIRLALPR